MWLPATHGRIIELIALKYPSIHPIKKAWRRQHNACKENTKKTDCTLLGGALVEDLNNEREREGTYNYNYNYKPIQYRKYMFV